MSFQFVIPGRLSGLNEIVAAARYNRFAGAKQKKDETTRVRFWIMMAKAKWPRPTYNFPVSVKFAWYEPNLKRDPDNVMAGGTKIIMDALVLENVILNDSRKWVKALVHEFPEPDKKEPRVEVTVDEQC